MLNITAGLNNNSQWEVVANKPATLTVRATDADGDAITYVILNNVKGVTVANNGTIFYNLPNPNEPVSIV